MRKVKLTKKQRKKLLIYSTKKFIFITKKDLSDFFLIIFLSDFNYKGLIESLVEFIFYWIKTWYPMLNKF